MTRYFDTDFAALDAIEDDIEAYGRARYSPSGPVLARIRANVMAEAAAAAATIAAERRLLAVDTDVTPPTPATTVWTIGRLRLPVFQRLIFASPGRRSMPAGLGSRPSSSKTPAGASTRRAHSPRPGPI